MDAPKYEASQRRPAVHPLSLWSIEAFPPITEHVLESLGNIFTVTFFGIRQNFWWPFLVIYL